MRDKPGEYKDFLYLGNQSEMVMRLMRHIAISVVLSVLPDTLRRTDPRIRMRRR